MKRCLVISDSFKGTLSSPAICCIARSLAVPGWQVDALPVADGGEGTVDCFLDACGGQRVTAVVSDPFGAEAESFYGLLPGGTAVVECAAAAGLPLAEGRLDPERTTTYGVGQLMAAALDNGAKRLILGLGGSCTNDGGCGAAAALGVRFFDRQGRSFVPTGITLADIADVDLSRRHPALDTVSLTVMCDIDNPLYGALGAAYVFAPQKGADAACVQRLDEGLRHFAAVLRQRLGIPVDKLPGGGAAGASAQGVRRCWAVRCAPASRRCWTPWTLTAAPPGTIWSSPARGGWTARVWAVRRCPAWPDGAVLWAFPRRRWWVRWRWSRTIWRRWGCAAPAASTPPACPFRTPKPTPPPTTATPS